MEGIGCRLENYRGYFLELNSGVGPFAAGLDIGLENDGIWPTSSATGVNELGLGLGFGPIPIGAAFCWYVPVDQKIEQGGCSCSID